MPGKTKITFADSARDDLQEILGYYREQQVPEVGDRFVREIIAAVEELAVHPERGRMVPEFSSPRLRELIHPPFRIVYRCFDEKLSVVRVWRSERLLRLPV